MSDIQRLIESTFPFVQDLLSKYGEFYPLAAAVTTSGNIAQIGTYDGEEHPLSDKVIEGLKRGLKAKQADYKSIVIFYDVRVLAPTTKLKTDAVAVFAETRNEETAYLIFYPYVLTNDKKIELTDNAWKEATEKAIFIN